MTGRRPAPSVPAAPTRSSDSIRKERTEVAKCELAPPRRVPGRTRGAALGSCVRRATRLSAGRETLATIMAAQLNAALTPGTETMADVCSEGLDTGFAALGDGKG